MNKFIYKPESHTYWQQGKKGEYFRIPSVTEICKPLLNYDNVPEEILRSASEYGTNIHETVKLWHKGTLDESSLVEGNRIALEDYKIWWNLVGKGLEGAIVDIKTRKPIPHYDSAQFAGYEILLQHGIPINLELTFDKSISNTLFVEEPFGCEKLMFGGTPDIIKYNAFHLGKYVLYLKPHGGYEFVKMERKQATSMFRTLLKNWWENQKTNELVEKWRK